MSVANDRIKAKRHINQIGKNKDAVTPVITAMISSSRSLRNNLNKLTTSGKDFDDWDKCVAGDLEALSYNLKKLHDYWFEKKI